MKLIHSLAVFCGASAFAFAQSASAEPGAEAPSTSLANNSGQNVSRPLTRFDTRIEYSNLPNDRNQGTVTLRVDKPFNLSGGWTLNTRFDLPIVFSSVSGDPASKLDLDVNDVLTQILLVTPPQGDWSFAFGARVVAPFAKQGDLSSGKWKLGPTASVTRELPRISKGSFVGLLVRDTFSFAGRPSSPDNNVVTVQPSLNFELPRRWFVSLEPEVKLNALDRWKAFVPFDITLGKKVSDRMVVSLQADAAVIDTYENYDWKTEFRVGIFF